MGPTRDPSVAPPPHADPWPLPAQTKCAARHGSRPSAGHPGNRRVADRSIVVIVIERDIRDEKGDNQ